MRGVGSSPLKKLEDALLRAVRVRCPMPLSVVVLPQSLNARDWSCGSASVFLL